MCHGRTKRFAPALMLCTSDSAAPKIRSFYALDLARKFAIQTLLMPPPPASALQPMQLVVDFRLLNTAERLKLQPHRPVEQKAAKEPTALLQ